MDSNGDLLENEPTNTDISYPLLHGLHSLSITEFIDTLEEMYQNSINNEENTCNT
jgi:hypothetical protein